MTSLPRTRDFSASNWQRLLAKQQPDCGPLIGVYMMLTFFRAERTAGPFGTDLIRNQIRQPAVQDSTSAMNKHIGGMEALIYVEGKRWANTAFRFIDIKNHIVMLALSQIRCG